MLATAGTLSGGGEWGRPLSIILVVSSTGGGVGLSCFSLTTSHCTACCIWVLIVGTKLGGGLQARRANISDSSAAMRSCALSCTMGYPDAMNGGSDGGVGTKASNKLILPDKAPFASWFRLCRCHSSMQSFRNLPCISHGTNTPDERITFPS